MIYLLRSIGAITLFLFVFVVATIYFLFTFKVSHFTDLSYLIDELVDYVKDGGKII